MHDLIEVIVRESAPDFASGQYRVVLQDRTSNKILSIWVGQFEGSAIALGLEDAWTPRPMTHDLFAMVLEQCHVGIERVVITDLKDNTFYAVIHMQSGGHRLTIDSRPSDAIALAVRSKAPVFVSERLAGKMADELDEIFDRMQPGDTIH